MSSGPPNPKQLGRYLALAQVGMEMVVPVGIGSALDYYLDWTPWGSVGGAALGFVVGLTHLITLAKQSNDAGLPRRPQEPT